jgi:hypothetical protein
MFANIIKQYELTDNVYEYYCKLTKTFFKLYVNLIKNKYLFFFIIMGKII